MDDFIIVPMTTDAEAEEKGYVHWKSWHETYRGLMPDHVVENHSLERSIESARRKPENTLVLKVDGRVVGFIRYGDNGDGDLENAGEVSSLYVLQEYQGQKLGYALMNAAVAQLSGKSAVALWVLKGNEKAIRFYKRYGFHLDGTEDTVYYGTILRMVLAK